MARLYLDHNVSRYLVTPLRFAGHDLVTARDLGLAAVGDERQLLEAARQHRAVITHNRGDFTLLHDAWLAWPAAFELALPAHGGILLLDQDAHEALVQAVIDLIEATAAKELSGELLWWRRRAGWHRRLPDRGWEPYSP